MRSEAKFVYYAIFHEIDIPKTGGFNNIGDPPTTMAHTFMVYCTIHHRLHFTILCFFIILIIKKHVKKHKLTW